MKSSEREAVRKAEEEFFEKYKVQISLFQRNFFASPYEKIFAKAIKGIKKVIDNNPYFLGKLESTDKVEFSPSENEGVWILPEGQYSIEKNSNSFLGDKVAVFFAIHFDDSTEKTIAKLILSVELLLFFYFSSF